MNVVRKFCLRFHLMRTSKTGVSLINKELMNKRSNKTENHATVVVNYIYWTT